MLKILDDALLKTIDSEARDHPVYDLILKRNLIVNLGIMMGNIPERMNLSFQCKFGWQEDNTTFSLLSFFLRVHLFQLLRVSFSVVVESWEREARLVKLLWRIFTLKSRSLESIT